MYELIAIVGIIGIFAFVTAKTVLNHQGTGSKYLKMKMKEMEDVIEFQKKQVQRYKNKAAQLEVAPQMDYEIEGKGDELGEILPEIIGEFGNNLPKWAHPFLKDPQMIKWAVEYASKNPDSAKKWFNKLTGKKSESKESGEAKNEEKLLGDDVLSL